jgi:hypothetical protein
MGIDRRHAEGEGGAGPSFRGRQEPAQLRHDGGAIGTGLSDKGDHDRSRL